ncbi:MAG: hypothetical protein AAGC70_13795 [Pseudomonadota bacterium]
MVVVLQEFGVFENLIQALNRLPAVGPPARRLATSTIEFLCLLIPALQVDDDHSFISFIRTIQFASATRLEAIYLPSRIEYRATNLPMHSYVRRFFAAQTSSVQPRPAHISYSGFDRGLFPSQKPAPFGIQQIFARRVGVVRTSSFQIPSAALRDAA